MNYNVKPGDYVKYYRVDSKSGFILLKVKRTKPYIDPITEHNNGLHIIGTLLYANYKLNSYEIKFPKISLTLYPHIRYEVVNKEDIEDILDMVMVDKL